MGINTGAAIPPGADAVLQSELAEVANGSVRATEPIPVGQHIRVRGEDVHAGDLIAPAGEPLTLARVSSLAAAGVAEMTVHRRARLHLLVTGSELLPLGAPPEPGKIHESNGLMVRLLAERAGAEVIDHGVIGDDFESTRAAVETGLAGRRAGRLGRRLGRPARPRQAGLRGLRRRGGLLARAREARQAAVVRPPRLDARVRPARQPALEHRRLPRLHRARPAPPARRARPGDAHRARPA